MSDNRTLLKSAKGKAAEKTFMRTRVKRGLSPMPECSTVKTTSKARRSILQETSDVPVDNNKKVRFYFGLFFGANIRDILTKTVYNNYC